MRRQKMLTGESRDLDVFALARDEDAAYGVVLQVRGGKVLGKERRGIRGTGGENDGEVMAAFLGQYYRERDSIPREIATAWEPSGSEVLSAWLQEKAGRPVAIRVPQRGRLAGLARLAEENARIDLESARGKDAEGGLDPSVYELQKALGLAGPPVRIEGFDISNLQSEEPVASLVVFQNGKPLKSAYRRYIMRSAEAPNDFAMMAEVVGRRAARIVAGEFPVPDLLLIDGGEGQVGAALTALEQEGLDDVAVAGLAKREEEIVLPGRKDRLVLSRRHAGLKLLMRVRDEAHRFALRHHRSRRARKSLASRLDGIPGVGSRRRELLLHAFGSLDGVERAGVEELAAVPGIGPALAREIAAHLHGDAEAAGAA
jgi:excinuclease ABC subunit C